MSAFLASTLFVIGFILVSATSDGIHTLGVVLIAGASIILAEEKE